MRTLAILSALGYFVQGQTYVFEADTCTLDGNVATNAECCRAFAAQGDDPSMLEACLADPDEETIMMKEVFES